MTSIDRTPAATALTKTALAWISATTMLVATAGAVLLGLTGHTALAASVAAIGCAGVAGGARITINIRR
jgi:hypothetical protein